MYPASEKGLEIIYGLVRGERIPARRTLETLGILPVTRHSSSLVMTATKHAGVPALEARPSDRPGGLESYLPRGWGRKRIIESGIGRAELFTWRELATRFSADTESDFCLGRSSLSPASTPMT